MNITWTIFLLIPIILTLWIFITQVYQRIRALEDKFDLYRHDIHEYNNIISDRISELQVQRTTDKAFRSDYYVSADPYICEYCHKPVGHGMQECANCGAPLYNHNSTASSYFKNGGVRVRGYMSVEEVARLWQAKD